MDKNTVWAESVKSHLSDMLKELAELADAANDEGLHSLAFRLRLMAADPALKVRGEREVLLHCDRTGLSLIAEPQRQGDRQFHLECESGAPPPVQPSDRSDERSAVRAFVEARAELQSASGKPGHDH